MREARAPGEPVGSLGEEAVRLMSAMSAWAEEHSGPVGEPAPSQAREQSAGEQPAGCACQWCPVCQVAAKVRSANPELRHQLVLSGLALTSAARALLESLAAPPVAEPEASVDVEHIDLSDERDAQPWD